MAKYTRFDPRNKKQNRHKKQYMEKDFRLHETGKKQRVKNLLKDYDSARDKEEFYDSIMGESDE